MASSGTAPAAKPSKCLLEPIDFGDESQCAELLRQRVLCGWANTPGHITAWRAAMDAGTKPMFWIKPASRPDLRAGHVSLASEAEPADPELADPRGRSVLTIARLFVLPAHRGGGIGRAAVEALERCAREEPYGSPGCRAVAVTTLSRRYYDDDESRRYYEVVSGRAAPPRGTGNEEWYARMGYVKWKDQPLYPGDRPGFEHHKLVAAYMRKAIV